MNPDHEPHVSKGGVTAEMQVSVCINGGGPVGVGAECKVTRVGFSLSIARDV